MTKTQEQINIERAMLLRFAVTHTLGVDKVTHDGVSSSADFAGLQAVIAETGLAAMLGARCDDEHLVQTIRGNGEHQDNDETLAHLQSAVETMTPPVTARISTKILAILSDGRAHSMEAIARQVGYADTGAAGFTDAFSVLTRLGLLAHLVGPTEEVMLVDAAFSAGSP